MTVSEENKPKRRGRPPIERPERKLANVTFRVRGTMREQLQTSANARGLSISEEVERRIALSFELASSPHNEYVIRSAATALNMVEGLTKNNWGQDKLTAQMCHSAVVAAASVLTAIHDKSDNVGEHALIKAAGNVIGIRTALMFAGFSIESVVKFGRTDIDLAIDVIRRKIVQQVGKAVDRDPETVNVEIVSDENRGLGAPYPPNEQNIKPEEVPRVIKRTRKVKY